VTAATAFWAGTAVGLAAALLLTNAVHRAFAWAAHRIDRHVTAALEPDPDLEFRRLVARIDDEAA
jgi:hypothetical protein